eukprot:CAMPEP_0119084364 /NCGR_PEP_ID=MMETSP1178-20130426/129377_1 /TAXON_ID=33656 /ORGANISM="unid sp, Strain CCMP2000" /LENGTH=45 /DNA_ID= /DNA_START= /DNA_END= /DNA_ORIENTATION=
MRAEAPSSSTARSRRTPSAAARGGHSKRLRVVAAWAAMAAAATAA